MVTVKKKSTPQPLHQQTAELRKANNDKSNRAIKTNAAGQNKVTDRSFTEQADSSSPGRESVVGEGKRSSSLVARGKDLLSDEAGGVATAAAIVVGAALIEVELIPGLIIGAGAILLGKLFPEMSGYVRPVVKSVVRAGFSATQKIREVMAEASEQVHDLVAEVKKEQEQEQPQSAKQNQASSKVKAATGGLPVH